MPQTPVLPNAFSNPQLIPTQSKPADSDFGLEDVAKGD